MGHRSDGRGYIRIVNTLLLLSVHTTCHRRCQAKVAVTVVVWRFPPHYWNGKRHCHSLTIYPASKTCCTQRAAPTSCLGHPVYSRNTDLSWSDALQNTSVMLTSLPHTHNRIGPHCSHKSETSCPTPALLRTETEALSGGWCNDLIMWPYSSHSVGHLWLMTISCTLVTRDWWPYHVH